MCERGGIQMDVNSKQGEEGKENRGADDNEDSLVESIVLGHRDLSTVDFSCFLSTSFLARVSE